MGQKSRRSTSAIRHARPAPARIAMPLSGSLRRAVTGLLAVTLTAGTLIGIGALSASAADPCTPPTNPVACENSKPGADYDEWDVPGKGDSTVEGFAGDISVNAGQRLDFKVKSDSAYTLKIYRLGYYDNKGARFITELPTLLTTQGTCRQDPTVALYDCGNWSVTSTWNVPADQVSGVYIAKVSRTGTDAASHIPFIVRNDSSRSDLVFQTSDTTWHAYNPYGLGDFYSGGGNNGRAYKVSYNRPVPTHGDNTLFAYEFPMIKFMEAQGYDVSYVSGIDNDRLGNLLPNHRTLVTAGHDEYWSGQQRANVKAARDAGVNLAFFAGNDMYWKTRYENSIDGSGTPYRTLVCYKETWADAKLDTTSPEWTGTWRDPRFSTAPNGALPENELVGTAYMANYTDLAMEIPAADGKMRLWRNTSVANLAAGAKATLPPHTVGYESNEDLDNGFRPAGTIRLSDTTGPTPEYLRDYGKVVTPGTTRHNMTMYRAASGARVFSAGTIQWSWGLDTYHDGPVEPVDVRMRQATVNLFADMDAQPKTLQSDLTIATRTTDGTAPTSAITSPAAGATVAGGNAVTISGTASDVGGRVGGIEVSTDGGQRWHPATTGRDTWTYTWNVSGLGQTEIQVRAADDSGNIQSVPTKRTVNVTCPCTLFPGVTPTTPSTTDGAALNLGVRWTPQLDGWVTGITFYKGEGNTGTHIGTLWNAAGDPIAQGTFVNETATGWQTLRFGAGVRVTAGTTYVASYTAPNGRYAADSKFFSFQPTVSYPLTAPASTETAGNGVFATGATPTFPRNTYNDANYYVSPVFDTVEPPDTIAPTVASVSPIDAASSIKLTATPKVTFDEPIKAGTAVVTVTNGAGGQVAGTTAFDDARRVATFTPSVPLTGFTTYTLRVTGATDAAGNVLAPFTSTFRTVQISTPGECPCSLWTDSDEPAITQVDDTEAVNVGVKFTASENGFVSGIRFYKGVGNTGTHVGSLWNANGDELAGATFQNESSTGWQEVRFAQRVAVTAGTVYVASYNAPVGRYAATNGGFSSAIVNPPLTAPANSPDGNGVYKYGAKAFPATATGSNYWVDVVFELPPDTTPPAVASTSPAANGTNALLGTKPVVTFTERVTAAVATLRKGAVVVPTTLALDSMGRKATLTPGAALEAGTEYTLTVTSAIDRAGNVLLAPFSSTFTTAGVAVCPCSLFPSDYTPAVQASDEASAYELGVRFTPAANGYVTGMRFYKGAGNTGTHTGTLWNAGGGLITTATFENETASGWQKVTFGSPVPVIAGTTYVASYSAPNGHYSADAGLFGGAWTNGPLVAPADTAGAGNGVYGTTLRGFPNRSFGSTSYGVDVTFTAAATNDETPPGLVSTSPINGATSVPTNQVFTARFNEAMATSAGTITLTNGTVVPSTTTVGTDNTVTVTPNAALAYKTAYTIRITGSDLAGNALTAPVTWTVETARQPSAACPCSLWSDETAPTVASTDDTDAIEVGVKFTPSSNGYVTGLRFYKGPGNTGTHVGTLWDAAGNELRSATFQAESTQGWQEVTFTSPVQVTAGTTYVASYNAPRGGYAYSAAGLASGVTNGPLSAPAGSAAAPNGVYKYGAKSFPAAGSDANYWVDAVFDTVLPADTTPPTVTTRTPAAAATSVSPGTVVNATFSEAMSPATVGLTLRTSAGATVGGAASYDATTRTVSFVPSARLADTVAYTVTATGSDLAGNALAATSWSFTTGDGTPPTITTRTPAAGATNVAPATAPTATFSEPIAAGSLIFTVSDAGTPVAGAVAYNATTRVATFTPTGGLPQAKTLTASVQAADTVGNPMAAPSTWTFATADQTAPVVSAVLASGSGTSATVTWTTNEPATSRVTYGTTATNLSLTANGPAGTRTSHSVALTGLTANTRYYYRVVSADAANNSTTSPATTAAAAQYAPAPVPVVQNTTQFSANTAGMNGTAVSTRANDPNLLLAPGGGMQEFTTVPSTWSSTSLATGSSVSVANGVATVSGRQYRSTATFSAGREFDAIATMRPVANQGIGITSSDFSGTLSRYAAFETTANGGLVAESRSSILSSSVTTTTLSSSFLGSSRRFEIDFNSNQIVFSVDGTVVATHNKSLGTGLFFAARDQTQDANPVILDSVWVSPYTSGSTYTSTVFDAGAGAAVTWGPLTVSETKPTGTGITYQVRIGTTAPPATSAAWTTVTPGAAINLANARYFQWRATLTTTNVRTLTPRLASVTTTYTIP